MPPRRKSTRGRKRGHHATPSEATSEIVEASARRLQRGRELQEEVGQPLAPSSDPPVPECATRRSGRHQALHSEVIVPPTSDFGEPAQRKDTPEELTEQAVDDEDEDRDYFPPTGPESVEQPVETQAPTQQSSFPTILSPEEALEQMLNREYAELRRNAPSLEPLVQQTEGALITPVPRPFSESSQIPESGQQTTASATGSSYTSLPLPTTSNLSPPDESSPQSGRQGANKPTSKSTTIAAGRA